jgi:ribonucleoside-diphosphate reductase alpha chain
MEVFLTKGSTGGCLSWMTCSSRLISCSTRTGTPFEYIIDQLKSAPTCPSYTARRVTKKDTSKGDSCSSAVAYVLEEMHKEVLNELGLNQNEHVKEAKNTIKSKVKNPCPECGEELQFEGGCNQCKSCGYSRCD